MRPHWILVSQKKKDQTKAREKKKCTHKYFCVNCLICWLVAYLYLFSSIFVRLFIFSWKSNLFVSIFSQYIVNVNDHLRRSQRMCVKAFGSCFKARLMHRTFFFLSISLYGYKIAHFSKYQKEKKRRRSHNKKISELCIVLRKGNRRSRTTNEREKRREKKTEYGKQWKTNVDWTVDHRSTCARTRWSEWIGSSSTLYAACTSHMAIQIVGWCNNEKSSILFWPSLLTALLFWKRLSIHHTLGVCTCG